MSGPLALGTHRMLRPPGSGVVPGCDQPHRHAVGTPGPAVPALLALSCAFAVAGCGGSTAERTSDATPAIAPSGPSAHDIAYTCRAGRQGSILVSLPDPRQLADVLNPIDVCEYDGGLADVRLMVACAPGGPRTEARIRAVDGRLTASTARTICG